MRIGRHGIGWALAMALLGCDSDEGATVDAAADPVRDEGLETGPDSAPDPVTDAAPDQGPESDLGPGSDLGPAPDAGPPPTAGNVLLIIADDLGIDHAECYPEADGTIAPTPNIRRLCEQGVVFDAAWAMPVCSPTRASTLTGMYPFRTGIYGPIGREDPGLSPDALALPRALDDGGAGVDTALFGKWHLAGEGNDEQTHPNDAGFDHYAGFTSGAVPSYTGWRRTENGRTGRSTDYTTTAFVDDALAWLDGRDGPWFAMVAFNAPHTPLHLPPAALHSQDDLDGSEADIEARPADYYRAMIEAMDTEIGRLLDGIDPAALAETTIIYFGDNGSPAEVVQTPYSPSQRKDTLYEGGVRVPFVIAGAAVRAGGRRVPHPVDVTDVFPTVLELAGVDPPPSDGVSLAPYLSDPDAGPQRAWSFAQRGPSNRVPTIGSAARDDAYKLVREADGAAQLYHLAEDPFEQTDLLQGDLSPAEQMRYEALDAVIDAVLGDGP